ncbi:MAG TPA: hypothetical protein VLU24_08165 [Mycobacterium sp.]|nr:hypothetical protein [Mycobacterium sp.]
MLLFWLAVLVIVAYVAHQAKAQACAGPAPCTSTGVPSVWLQLCKPGKTDPNWHVGLNGNVDELDKMFPNCALAPAFGGTGNAETPLTGDLLVGANDNKYHLLAVGLPGDVLQTDPAQPLGIGWAPPCGHSFDGPPDASTCVVDADRGRCAIDRTNSRLYVCNGASRGWDYIGLNP